LNESTYGVLKERVREDVADALENGEAITTIKDMKLTIIAAFNDALKECDTPEEIYKEMRL
jgi:hypothetical protein